MRLGRTSAFVLLALLAGGIVSQLPAAMADDSANPFSALWDAIFDLQNRDDALQAQIDELRAERSALLVQAGEPALASNLYASIDVEAEDGRTLVHVTAGNNGPDRAAGVKLTTFYLMPLFEINSIDGSLCEDKSRGIIECIVGTLEEGQEYAVTIDATARESGMANTWTVDVSTTTGDSDYSDNHVTYDFETGSGERIEIPQAEHPEEELVEEQEPATEQEEPEQDGGEPTNSTETEEPQENASNQTSTEPEQAPSENQTSSETVAEDTGSNGTSAEAESDGAGNQTLAAPEETVDESDSSGNATESESAEQPEETPEEQPEEQAEGSGGSEEESTADEAPEEGSEESEGAGEEEESAPEEEAPESEESEDSGESGEEENPPQ
jgi:hypothetical protein